LIDSVERISAAALSERQDKPTIVDVRSAKEYAGGHLEGSLNIPLNHLEARLDELPADGEMVVHCQGGYRSSIAASLIKRSGRPRVIDLVGGFKAWQQSGLPVAGDPSGATCEVGKSGAGTCSA
jgi:rhodanese-related sulfurtransferase